MKWLKPLILWVPLHLPLSWIQPLHYSAWDEQKKKNNPGSFDAQYLWAYKVTRHSVAWYRPETKAWTKPELASLLSVAMTTAAVSRLKKRKKSPQRTCGEGLHPLGEFTDLTWQPKFNIIILFTWKHETRRLQMDTFPKSSSLSWTSIHVHRCPVWPFHSVQLDAAQGVLLLLAGAEAGWAGCSLNATLLGPPPSFHASLSRPTADSLSHVGSSLKRFCCLCTCSHLIQPRNTVRIYWGRI